MARMQGGPPKKGTAETGARALAKKPGGRVAPGPGAAETEGPRWRTARGRMQSDAWMCAASVVAETARVGDGAEVPGKQ